MPRGRRTDYANKRATAQLLRRLEQMVGDLRSIVGLSDPRGLLPAARGSSSNNTATVHQLNPVAARKVTARAEQILWVANILKNVTEPYADPDAPYEEARLSLTQLKRELATTPLNLKRIEQWLKLERHSSLPHTSSWYSKKLDCVVELLQKHHFSDVDISKHLIAAGYAPSEVSPSAIAARSQRLRARGSAIPTSPRARNRPRSKRTSSRTP